MADSKFCAGCLRGDENNTAEAWCCDCTEMVCKTCSSFHKRLSPPHKVVSIEKVSSLSSSLLKLSRNCEIHNDQKIVLFCCQHDQLICDVCFSESHQNCKPVISIEMAAKGVNKGTAVSDLEKRVDNLTQIIESILTIYNREISNLGEETKNIKGKVADIRGKITAHLDKLEADFNKEIDSKFNECSEKLTKNKFDIQRRYNALKTWREDLNSLKDTTSNVHFFHAIKYLDVKTHREETEFRNFKTDVTISTLTFSPFAQISKIRETIPSFCVVSLDSSSIPIQQDLDIDQQCQALVRAAVPKALHFETSKLGDDVMISRGCFLPVNKLLLCDYWNKRVHLCDHDGSNTKTIDLDFIPLNVTLYDKNTAIVSPSDKCIQIIDLRAFKPGRLINVGGSCGAVTSLNGEIWVSTGMCTLTMVDIKGKVQKKVSIAFDPYEICLSKAGDIYCTDNGSNAVHVVTSSGEERVVYSSPDLTDTVGITVDEHGNIYIAGFASNNIHRVSSDGHKSNIILTEEDGINEPRGLSFNHQTKELMVVNNDLKSINMYKMS